MIFNNKRGISPLVATILLIAFAVSIGALIMNWSSSESSSAVLKTGTCSVVELSMLSSCQSDTEISLSLKNSGNSLITAVILRSDTGGRIDYFVPSSAIEANTNRVIRVSKNDFNKESFSIIPVINSDSNELSCTSKALTVSSLVVC